MQYEQTIEEDVGPYVRSRTSFGGMYFDEIDGGHLVVLLTADDATIQHAVEARMPNGPSVEFRTVEYSHAELQAATRRVFDIWPSVTDLPGPYHATLDTIANRVTVLVDPSFVTRAEVLETELSSLLGVPVSIGSGYPAEAEACSSRDNCTNPIKSAVLIRKGSNTGSPCTMAFQIIKNGDIQFLTAAHCATSGSNNWYHKGYGYLGNEQQSLWSSGYDAVRIGFPDSQKTNWMYDDGYVVGWSWPSVGEVVIQNEAMSDSVNFTEILDDWTCWSYSGQTLCGAKMEGVGGVGGDSGAPLYRFFSASLYAVGINFGGDGNGNGLLTRVGDVLSRMGITLYAG